MAEMHRIGTIETLSRLYRTLPLDRAGLMLSEVVQGIRANRRLSEIADTEIVAIYVDWTDDDLGELEVELIDQ